MEHGINMDKEMIRKAFYFFLVESVFHPWLRGRA